MNYLTTKKIPNFQEKIKVFQDMVQHIKIDKKNARTGHFAVQNAWSLFFAPFETLLPFCELVSSRRAVVWSFNTLSAIYSVMILIWTITFICVLFDLAPVMISREQVSKRWKLSTHVQIYIDHQISFILMLPRGYVLVPKSYIYKKGNVMCILTLW